MKLFKKKNKETKPLIVKTETIKELTDTEYNEKMKEQFNRSVDCLRSSLNELTDWSHQCQDGFFVYEPRIDQCLFHVDSILEDLKKNYQKSTVVKCEYCGQEFRGYFAKEKESTHAVKEHGDEITASMAVIFGAIANSIHELATDNKALDSLTNLPNKATWKSRNIK